VIFPTRQGIRFLGYRVLRTHLGLARENVFRFRRRLRKLQRQYARRQISLADAGRRIVSWIGHARRQADTYRLRKRLFAEHPFRRAATV
jgi:RNA-directed DNA polymerase